MAEGIDLAAQVTAPPGTPPPKVVRDRPNASGRPPMAVPVARARQSLIVFDRTIRTRSRSRR